MRPDAFAIEATISVASERRMTVEEAAIMMCHAFGGALGDNVEALYATGAFTVYRRDSTGRMRQSRMREDERLT